MFPRTTINVPVNMKHILLSLRELKLLYMEEFVCVTRSFIHSLYVYLITQNLSINL